MLLKLNFRNSICLNFTIRIRDSVPTERAIITRFDCYTDRIPTEPAPTIQPNEKI